MKQDKEVSKGCVLYLAPLVPAVGMPMLLASPVLPQRQQDDSGVKHTNHTDSKDGADAQQ